MLYSCFLPPIRIPWVVVVIQNGCPKKIKKHAVDLSSTQYCCGVFPCRNMLECIFRRWSHVWLIAILIEVAKSACPVGCTCNTNDKYYVDCRNGNLDRIPWDLPVPMALRQLDLSHNQIREIVAEIAVYPNLEYLNLGHNDIFNIAGYVFQSLPLLKSLYIDNNKLVNLSRQSFTKLRSLQELDLSGNHLTRVSNEVFAEMHHLVSLHLTSNHIEIIEDNAFANLDSLKFLYLSHNHIHVLHSAMLRPIPQLTELLIDMNNIAQLSEGVFRYTQYLKILSLEGNNLASLPISLQELPNVTSAHSSIEKLSFKNNKLLSVPNATLARLTNVETLDISQNLIMVVKPYSFRYMHRLSELRINFMPTLEQIDEYAFAGLHSLKLLEIHTNPKLKGINSQAFSGLSSLEVLDIHGNSLTVLHPSMAEWKRLKKLDISMNPWHCNCEMQWLGEVVDLVTAKDLNVTVILQESITCASPPELAGEVIRDLSVKDFLCEKPPPIPSLMPEPEGNKFQQNILIAIIAGFAGILIVCIILLAIRHHKPVNKPPATTIITDQRRRRLRRRLEELNKEYSTPSLNHSLANSLASVHDDTDTDDEVAVNVKFVKAAGDERMIPADRQSLRSERSIGGQSSFDDLDDDAFTTDAEPDVVIDTPRKKKRYRKVSFNSKVVVRTCLIDSDSLPVCPIGPVGAS